MDIIFSHLLTKNPELNNYILFINYERPCGLHSGLGGRLKKLLLLCLFIVPYISFAKPLSPMLNYTPTDIANHGLDVQRIWNSMHSRMKGKDCYKRAHIWSYDMYKKFGVKSKKIFIHYTNKWNYELDDLGGEKLYGGFLGSGALKRKSLKYPGISRRDIGVIRSNSRWVYHVATTIVDNEKDVVLDRTLRLAYDAKPGVYTDDEGWDLIVRPSTPTEWMESLTVRGEILWKIRKAKLKEEISEARSSSRRRKLRNTMLKLGMIDANGKEVDRIDITCRRADSIATADLNPRDEWCVWTEAPMYYWNEIDLRYAVYGKTRYSYSFSPPKDIHKESNYVNGKNFFQSEFNSSEVKMSQGEKK